MQHFVMAPLLVTFAAGFLAAQESTPISPSSTGQESHLQGAARCLASRLIGCRVINSKNEGLGEIQEIVLDCGSSRIAYAVVAFRGDHGLGEKSCAMPWRLFDIGQRGTDDAPRATLGLDQKTLEAAPGFDQNEWPDMGNDGWAHQVDAYYRPLNEKARPAGAVEAAGSVAHGKSGDAKTPGTAPVLHRRLSKVIGTSVVDPQQRKLADVEDLVVDTKLASVDATLISFGGVLGVGERFALVPTESSTLDRVRDAFVFPCTRPALEAMALADGKLPALNSDTWLTRCRELCAKAAAALSVTNGDAIAIETSGVRSVPFADAYDVRKVESVDGTIVTIGSVRIGDGKEERVRLRIRTVEGPEIIVYAAPVTYEAQKTLGLRAGESVAVTGSPAKDGTRTVLVAGSIVLDGRTATLRDDQGGITWKKP